MFISLLEIVEEKVLQLLIYENMRGVVEKVAIRREQSKGESEAHKLVKNFKKKIFISWSGIYSKQIAVGLKDILENEIFQGSGIICFVSDVDIASGEDWWIKIKKELKNSGMGILCITKENVKEPWIYFEAGALVGNNIDTIPLLISCNLRALEHSPINGKQCVQFYEENKFLQMIVDINRKLQLLPLNKEQLDSIARTGYNHLKSNLKDTLNELKASRYFNEKYIYPSHVTTVNSGTVYISTPMSMLSAEEYSSQREFLKKLKELLMSDVVGFREVICPAINIIDKNNFDGKTKAIKENFVNLKQVDNLIVIYPRQNASSSLMETGYGIALTKQTVIFYKNQLPYMLKEAGETITHVRTICYADYGDILDFVIKNGKAMFSLGIEE